MSERFSDEQARRLWERATQLQAEAARRLESPSSDESEGAGEEESSGEGYAVDHVRQAAVDAGIDPEFVDQALSEARSGMLDEDPIDTELADRFLGPGPNWLVAERTLDMSVHKCLEAMQRVFPRLKLNVVDIRGGPPEKGGELIFETGDLTAAMKHRPLMELSYASVIRIHASFHPTDDGGCRIVLKAPQAKARRTSALVGRPTVLVTGVAICAAVMAMAVSALGAGGLTGLETVLGVGAGMGSGGVAGAAMRSGWRWMQNWGHRKGQGGLERLMQLVVTDARTDGGFTLPASASDGSGSDDDTLLGQLGL